MERNIYLNACYNSAISLSLFEPVPLVCTYNKMNLGQELESQCMSNEVIHYVRHHIPVLAAK